MGKVATLVKYSVPLGRMICDNVEDGITVAELCRTHKGTLPTEATIYRWKRQYPEFAKALFESYQTFFMKKIDEMDDLSNAKVPTVREDGTPMSNVEVNAEVNRRRLRMDALKFILAKIAPKMVPEFRDTPTTAIQVVPTINVVRYAEKQDDKP